MTCSLFCFDTLWDETNFSLDLYAFVILKNNNFFQFFSACCF